MKAQKKGIRPLHPSSTSNSRQNTGLTDLTDLELWQKFKQGDKAAFILIYNQYFDVLYSYGYQFTQDEELIKDCIHDVFAEIRQSRERLSDTNNIRYYLLKSFKSRFLYYQKKKSFLLSEDYYSDGYHFQFSFSTEQKIIEAQISHEKVEKLNRAVQKLSPRQREVIYYFFYEELSIDAIKELMNVSNRRSIQNIVYRALANLKDLITLQLFVGYYHLCIH
ncbi:sigma-70 family RNA polymerase sigma factor [Porifericola rhodea]|uniref:RNA polymerase sigma factor n=1 Tax=Porifericola rhodea TaxID=930972 RepID=UPI00266701BF|nr:sigma-70 family RNA polymerase sigma factor [Porifericola rhodea]WKN30653.1 sigma-70 family RNA polymerase sigma factor [Porifericola rhodea]